MRRAGVLPAVVLAAGASLPAGALPSAPDGPDLPPPAAQETAPTGARVRSSIDSTRITVGDRITLRISVEHPAGSSVVWPDSIDLAPFEILGARSLPGAERGDLRVSEVELTLTAFRLGELDIPPLPVEVVGPDGGGDTLTTDAFGVEVVSVGLDEGGDIREIRGPLTIPAGALRLLLLALLALVALALYLLYRRLRKSGAAPGPAPLAAPPLPPHEAALDALDRLAAAGLLERGEVKRFHIEASEIVRIYLEARFGVRALEMTTGELLAGVERAGVDARLRDELRAFFDACDLVKFAKHRPVEPVARETLALGRNVVVESAPRTPAPAEAGAPDSERAGTSGATGIEAAEVA